MTQIIPVPPPQKTELSTGKRQQYWRDAKRGIVQGFAMGVKGRFVIAANLWNIREHELYKEEGYKTLKAFIEESGIGQAQFYSLLQVGDRIRATSKCIDPIISQKEIKGVFEISHANFQDITVRSLFKAAQSQQAFEKLLSSGNIEEVKTEATKLLKPRKLSDQELATENAKERSNAIAADRAERYGHSWARLHNVIWDSKKKDWVNEDGSDLSDGQLAEMTEFSDAMEVWEDSLDIIAKACAEIYKSIHNRGKFYKVFSTRGVKKFHDEVKSSRRTIGLRLETMQDMIVHLFEGDIDLAEKVYKKSV